VGLGAQCFELATATPEALAAALERSVANGGGGLAARARELGRATAGYVERASSLLGLEQAVSAAS